jgi:SNF2 family DNA or RNA helicase
MSEYKFKTKPRRYQYQALEFLVKNKGVGALLMDPGTGKTKVTIDFLGILTAKRGSLKALVCAPLSALDTWVDETQLHLGYVGEQRIPTRIFILTEGSILDKAQFIKELDQGFEGLTLLIINHDAFKYRHKVKGLATVTVRDRILNAVDNHWCPDIVVVDEMHRLKTHSSNLSTAFKKIGQHAFMRVGLTGTVAPHSPLDFFGQWQFLNPLTFDTHRNKAWDHFRYHYAIWGGWEGKQVLGFYKDRIKEMKAKVAEDAFIVRKHEALDLPKVVDIIVPVHLTTELPYYREMAKELLVTLPSGKESLSKNTLTKYLRLRQITGGVVGYREPVGVTPEGDVKEVTRTEDIGNSKLRVLMDKVETIVSAGEKQVIFAHFRRDVQRIVDSCKKEFKSIPVYSITGDTKGRDRVTQRKAFYNHDGPAIFVAQMRTVSLAINEFVVANYGHFYSYSQLRDDFIQARDRLDRSGQTKPVTFYHYIVPHSIDSVILESHKEKGKLEAAVTRRAREILTLGEET